MKKVLIIIPVFLLLFSCKDKDDNTEQAFLVFYPRTCTKVLTASAKTYLKTISGVSKSLTFTDIEIVEDAPIPSTDYVLWIMTGDDSLKVQFNPVHDKDGVPNLKYFSANMYDTYDRYTKPSDYSRELEKELSDDYHGRKSGMRSTSSGLHYAYPIDWGYRTTGVKNFSITALSPLFGQPAGTSLNRYFSIYSFEPKQVISSETNRLLWGYRDNSNLERIDQWLSMKPMAPPVMTLKLNSVPPEVPTEVHFVTTFETTDGLFVRDTVRAMLK